MKRTLSIVLATILLLSTFVCCLSPIAGAANVGDLTFELGEQGYIITNCNKAAAGVLSIPAEYNNITICEIREEAFKDCKNLTDVTIPGNVKTIGAYAFQGCATLSNITLGEGIKIIEHEAFSGTSIAEITIPHTVKKMASYSSTHEISCFLGAAALKKVTFAERLQIIPDRALENCATIKEVILPNSLTEIGQKAFSGCSGLTNIQLPEDLQTIGSFAFNDCSNVKKISIPGSVQTIGAFAFNDCASLYDVTLGEGIKIIECEAFSGTSIAEITIPHTVKKMSSYYTSTYEISCFLGADALKKVTFAERLQIIPDRALENCATIKEVILPNSLTEIGAKAFSGCSGLTNIQLPEDLQTIGSFAFNDCSNVKKISIPGSVQTIGAFAFNDCASLYDVTLGEGIKIIEHEAFSGTSIAEITIPHTVKKMSSYYTSTYEISCFLGADALKKVTFAERLQIIPDRALENCATIKEVILPNSLTEIGAKAFSGCSGINKIRIPKKVAIIGTNAFAECSEIELGVYEGSYALDYAENEKLAYKTIICKHENATSTKEVPATCTKSGYSAGKYCEECETWLQGHEMINAKGHNYVNGVCTVCKNWQNAKAAPTISSVSNDIHGISVKWKSIVGASGYYVYRKAGSDKSWTKIATLLGGTKTLYIDANVKSGTKYTYTVKAFNGRVNSAYNKTGKAVLYLAAPSVSTSNSTNGINVKWSKVAGAKGYYVYRKAGSATSWTRVATIKSGGTVTWKDTKVSNGTTYKYTVIAYNSTILSKYINYDKTIKFLSTPKVTAVTSSKTGITVKWNRNVKATGYVIYRKTGNGSWVALTTIKKNTILSFVDKSAKKGVTYTYTVKAYNGSYKSSYYSGMSIKDKY